MIIPLVFLLMTDHAEDVTNEDPDVLQLDSLALCINLIELRLYEVCVSAAASLPDDTVLPNLTLLYLGTVGSGITAFVLNKLKLLALEALSLVGLCSDADQESITRSLVLRSQCPLTKLDLGGFGLQNAHPSLVTLLANTSNITKLEVQSNVLLPHLHYSPTSVLLPNLETFIIRFTGVDSLPQLLDMIESRSQGSAALRNVLVRRRSLWTIIRIEDSSLLTRLKLLQETGLAFTVQ
ncbi:hypothetical protein C8J56DRAFT_1140409 [Mycena floridula]|nr:hypothetical protein C8J56DRAFT_1140409 [Mycena floridula]